MQLRYNYRVDPTPGQRVALAKAFGCARVVWNDALAIRRAAHANGQSWPKTGDLSKQLITQAKRTPNRAWLGEVSAVVLQQSLRDLDTAYRNFFASLSGKRKGPKVEEPRFKSKRDTRQSARFTANARWKITQDGRLRLPGIGAIRVRWSRALPSTPSTVTMVKDSSGRYFASFVVETDPTADLERFGSGDELPALGLDLGLTHFAVLSDGRTIDSPKFLRRAERKLRKAQQNLARRQRVRRTGRRPGSRSPGRMPAWPTRGATSTTSSPRS